MYNYYVSSNMKKGHIVTKHIMNGPYLPKYNYIILNVNNRKESKFATQIYFCYLSW